MNQEKGGSKKKSFNYATINLLIFCVTLIIMIWGALFAYFNFTPGVNNKVCFKSFGLTFGCIPDIMQKGIYYEPNTVIKLNDEFITADGKEAFFYIKEDNQKKETVSFSQEGDQSILLYVDYNGKTSKFEKNIKIGDGTPPVIVQNSVPVVKIGEVIDINEYITITDNKDPEPVLLSTSIIAEAEGKFSTEIAAIDNHNNRSTITFEYEIIA